jgi:chromosome segregation protein
MVIKKLEVQGFKSFSDRTKIAFHPGITAIVGPNGTGKSNLVDAMLWVLGGSRSKPLRGDRTEDIIFNGNAKRPPLGMADVVLSLGEENEDLTVSHRVFRSGEGEYRLNGKSVRLKDIQDELWKHAIGEASYFVIEQGAIGNFVTSKPTEKRGLLEEAAGTAFYKDKKRQAQNKLETTGQNLIRLEDIIAEVEKAKNSLQRQAQAANRYRRLRERLRELTSFHYQRKLQQLELAQREAADGYASCLAAEQDVTARVKEAEKELAERRRELWSLETSIKETREKQFSLQSQIARLEAEAERDGKRIEFFEEKKKRAEADRDELLEDVLLITRDLEDGRVRLEKLAAELEAGRTEAASADDSLGRARTRLSEKEKALGTLRESHLLSIQALTEARNEAVKTDKELELLLRQEEKMAGQLHEQEGLLTGVLRTVAEHDAAIREHLAARQARDEKIAAQKELLVRTEAELEALRVLLDERRQARDETSFHLQALRKLEEKERGEAAGADIPAGLGLLADLVRTAPEDATLFDVFWQDEARARVVPCGDFLREYRAEVRGNFLLIPDQDRAALPPSLLAEPGVLGFLKGRVQPVEAFRDGLRRLEDAVIVGGVPEAVRLWLRFPEFSYLTPAGDLLLSSGLLRLGQKGEGMIALTQEIRALAERLERLEAELSQEAAVLNDKAAARAALERELEAEKELRDREERALLDRQREHKFGRNETEKFQTSLEIAGRELALLRAEKDAHDKALSAIREQVAAASAEEVRLKEAIAAAEQELVTLQEADAAAERRFFELKAGQDLLNERTSGLRHVAEGLEKRMGSATAKIDLLEEDVRKSEAEKERLREAVKESGARRAALEEERRGAEGALAAAEQDLRRVQAATEELETGLTRTRAEEEAAKDGRVKREIRKAEVDRDLLNLEETCWQELKKTLPELRAEMEAQTQAAPPEGTAVAAAEAARESEEDTYEAEDEAEGAPPAAEAAEGAEAAAGPQPGEQPGEEKPKARRTARKWRPVAEMTDEEVERDLEEAREALNRFKAVNLMAEEEYLEQKKRYEFLVTQRQDLRESIASTEEAIKKIDEESKAQFLRAIEVVNKNFQEVFGLLFKGGNAEVKLLEPDNPLESGVEIVAQPPGKRVQNLSLLSGGEKSLTSLAFMFALFRYKPSPFCFLDEVDAALDDVNLVRFLDLLRQIKTQTQFLLVTHNYKTMEVADYIYGTTMEEPNITKLYSVKLEKKEETSAVA